MIILESCFQTCCENRKFEDITRLDTGEYICRVCGRFIGKDFIIDYNDYGRYVFKKYQGYKRKNHISHILNRIQCIEKNKPCDALICEIKKEIGQKNVYSKKDIYNVIKNPVLRKHVMYILCKLNNDNFLYIHPYDRQLIIDRVLEKCEGKKKKNYFKLIEAVVRENEDLDYIQRYLCLL